MSEELKRMNKEELIKLLKANIKEDHKELTSKDTIFNYKQKDLVAN